MRKLYQNTSFLTDLGANFFTPLSSYAAPISESLFMELDDYAGDTTTSGIVEDAGLPTSGEIEIEGDSDWFAVNLLAGQNFEVSYFETGDVSFGIYDSTGVEVTDTRNFMNFGENYFGFTADADAVYYVGVTGIGPLPGINYSFNGSTYNDDFSADTSTAGLLVAGETTGGVLEAVTDVDWIGIDLTAGEMVSVSVSSSGMEPDVRIYNSVGELISGYSTSLSMDLISTILTVTPTTTDRYYISVQNGFDGFPLTSYALSTFSDDYASDTSTTGLAAIDGNMVTINGEHETESDADWFAITLTENQTVEMNSGYDFGISYYDADGNVLTPDGYADDGTGFITSLTAMTAGTYYIGVSNDFFIAQPYNLTGTIYTDDYLANVSTTGILDIDGTVNGELQGLTDSDWFSITLTENERVNITSNLPDDVPLVLTLRDENGSFVASDFWAGDPNDSLELSYFVLNSGTYYVDVAFDFFASQVPLSYSLSATSEVLQPDIAGDISTKATIMPGETVSSDINNDTDSDWFAFSIEDGGAIKFSLTTSDGSNLPLAFYNSAGTTVVSNYYGGEYVFDLSSLALSGGDYFVGVSSYYDGTPSYDLTATAVEADIAGNTSTTAAIALGQAVSSIIDSNNDSDWFAFSLTQGQVVDFDWVVEDNRSLDYTVYDEQGNYISQLTYYDGVFAAPEAGNYFIAVSAYYDGLPTYSLSMNELMDDYAGNATTTGLIAGGEQLTVNFEYSTDVDWIKLDGDAGDILRLTTNENIYDYYVVDADNNIIEGYYYSSDASEISIDFVIPDSEDYFLRLVSDQYIWQEGQTLTVNAESVIDDFVGTVETTAILTPGMTQTIRNDFANDQDWFILDTSGGGEILLTITPPEFDPYAYEYFYGTMEIHDASGAVIQSFYVDQFSENAYSVSLDAGTTYYVSTSANIYDFDVEYSLSSTVLTLNGTDSADTLIGTDIDDSIFGDAGDDIIFGMGGDDVLMGGTGNDSLSGGLGSDILNGGLGSDTAVYSTAETGAVVDLSSGIGGAGSSAEGDSYFSIENIVGSASDDELTGDSTGNRLSGSDGNDTLFGLAGDDTLFGGLGDDVLDGGEGFDSLYGDAGADMLTGGAGDDVFHYQTLNGNLDGDVITDFSNYDRVDFSGILTVDGLLLINIASEEFTGTRGELRFEVSGNDTVLQIDTNGDGTANETLTFLNYTDGLQFAYGMQLYGIPSITGDADGNYLSGGDLAERFFGLDGNDTIYSYAGDDIVEAGSGDDWVYGGYGADDLSGGDGLDYVFGNSGNDILRGEAGTNLLIDTEGMNTFILTGGINFVDGNSQSVIDYSLASSGATADLMMLVTNAGAAEGDSYSGVDNITGSDFADRLYGDNDANMLIGGDGNDALFGRNGDDIFVGGQGRDIFSGGNGFDTVDYSVEAGAVTVDMMELIVASQAAEGDRLYSIESVMGTDFNDRIFGNNDDNLIDGGSGNDSLFGRNGADTIHGGQGDDLISAGAHNDIINGDAGNDRLYTGTGNDIVVFETSESGNDTVYDFVLGLDRILIDDDSGNFDSFGELMAAGSENGADVTFDFGDGNSLTIKGYTLAEMSETDFDFGSVPSLAEFVQTNILETEGFTESDNFDWGLVQGRKARTDKGRC